MDKLLYKEASGDLTCSSRNFDKVFATLYAYESTDRTPEQIEVMKVQVLNLSNVVIELQNIIDKLKEKLERQESLSHDLGKALDNLTELWEALPPEARTQAIKNRDSMKKSEVTP